LKKILLELVLDIALLGYIPGCTCGLVEMDTAKHGTIRYGFALVKALIKYLFRNCLLLLPFIGRSEHCAVFDAECMV
jgi:hypothetical protein